MDSKDYIALQRLPFRERLDAVYQFMARERGQGNLMGRMGDAPADTSMDYQDPASGKFSKMLIFGSNNYLGLANDPEILESVIAGIRKMELEPAVLLPFPVIPAPMPSWNAGWQRYPAILPLFCCPAVTWPISAGLMA